MRRISAVAVCCSRASFVSLNNRTFSMAMTAWSAKVCSSATCRSVKSCASVRRRMIAPSATPSRIKGTLSIVRKPRRRAFSLLSGNSPASACMSATCTVRSSSTDRPPAVPRPSERVNSPIGPAGIWPWWATRTSRSPSRRQMSASNDSHRRAALSATVSSTVRISAGEREITLRIWLVAASWSLA